MTAAPDRRRKWVDDSAAHWHFDPPAAGRRRGKSAAFEESKHPRGEGGQFASGGTGGGGTPAGADTPVPEPARELTPRDLFDRMAMDHGAALARYAEGRGNEGITFDRPARLADQARLRFEHKVLAAMRSGGGKANPFFRPGWKYGADATFFIVGSGKQAGPESFRVRDDGDGRMALIYQSSGKGEGGQPRLVRLSLPADAPQWAVAAAVKVARAGGSHNPLSRATTRRFKRYYRRVRESTKGYDPNETRDDSGRWTGSGAAAAHSLTPSHAGAVRRWAGLARHVGSRAMAPARKAARKVYAGIERRYGPRNAKRILGAMAVGMAVPLPGASLLAAAPMVALAELHRQLGRGRRPASAVGKGADMTDDEVLDAAEAALRELFGGELPHGWDRAKAGGADVGTKAFDPNEPRDASGEWTSGGGGVSGGERPAPEPAPAKPAAPSRAFKAAMRQARLNSEGGKHADYQLALAHAWADHPKARPELHAEMLKAGLAESDPVGSVVPFDARYHVTDHDVLPDDPVRVTSPGWLQTTADGTRLIGRATVVRAGKSAPAPGRGPAPWALARPPAGGADSDAMSLRALELVCKSPGVLERLPTPGLVGYAKRLKPEFDDGLMMCRGTLSTGSLDRSRDVVVCKGLSLANHRRNPIVLLLHDPERPIGRNEHPRTKEYAVRLSGDGSRLTSETFFTQHFEIGEQCFLLAKAGLLNGLSIGFRPDPSLVKKGTGPDGRPCTLIGGGELMETSLVLLPDNPDCTVELAEVVAKGFHGRPLAPELREVLSPMIPALKVWSKGWGDGLRRKAGYGAPGAAADPAPLDDPDRPAPDADQGPQMPAGAQALQGAYEWLTGHADFLEQAAAVNEHPEVSGVLAKLQTVLSGLVTTVASAFNKTYPDMPSLDPGTGYADPAPEPGGADPDAPPADPGEVDPGPDADPAGDDFPPDDLDDAPDMDDEEKKSARQARRGLRRLVEANLRKQIARRQLPERQRQQLARVAERLEKRPGNRPTSWWAVKELRAALAVKGGAAPAGEPAAVPELDLDALSAAIGPLTEKVAALGRDVAGITGKG